MTHDDVPAAGAVPVVAMEGITKRFGGTRALDDVGIDLLAGEVHALLGENGAGKSTLIKILTGLHQADEGRILIDGTPVSIPSPALARDLGVVAVYQEPLIFPDLSVAENIFLGHRHRRPVVNRRRQEREAAEILERLDVQIDPSAPANTLSVGEQQAVEIAKAISTDVRVLIMDEPTAALSAHEVEQLFRQVRRIRDEGVAVLFISHRLGEVFALCDRITVFRDGRHISTRPVSETDESLVVAEMVGRELAEFFARRRHEPGDVALAVHDLGRTGVFSGISFELYRGEVLGMAGLVGSGRTDIALALFGIAPADRGTIEIDGREVVIRSPQDALSHGIAYLSEDRRKLGLTLPQSLASNITLPAIGRYRRRGRLLDRVAERKTAERFRASLSIRAASLDAPVETLSGGNQQKVMLAKWLNTEPQILILDEPTRGIDVGAKADVHRLIDELASSGIAVLMISSDLPEVLAMSDRVLVMREGRSVACFDANADQERVMTAAVGAA